MPLHTLLLAAALILAAGCASVPETTDRMWPLKYEEEMATGGTELDFPFPFGRLFTAELDAEPWEDGDPAPPPETVFPILFPLLPFGRLGAESADPAPEDESFRRTSTYREHQVRPIYRRRDDESRGTEDHQIFWPIARVKYGPGTRQVWVLPLIFDRTIEVESTGKKDRDWMVFPFFGGTDSTQGRYFLLFPFVGRTYNLFGSERIDWLPWPIYVRAKDREYYSQYVMWPLIGWGKGGGKTMTRVLPFFGWKNSEGRSWSRNVLWPFFSWGEAELHTDFPIRYSFFFPFYGRQRSWDKEDGSTVAWQTTLLYPFFMWSGSRRGWREYQLFWPVYRYKVHPSAWAVRVWPFYADSRFYDASSVTWDLDRRHVYWLWPLGWHGEFVLPRGRQTYTMFVPFYRRSRYVSHDGVELGGDQQVWPLYRKRVAEDGSAVLSIPAPIPWSYWENLEANWDWLWTVIEARRSKDGKEKSQKWLWGLLRYRTGEKGMYTGLAFLFEHARDDVEETEKVELLKGLLGWETSEEDGDGIRLLWFLRIPL